MLSYKIYVIDDQKLIGDLFKSAFTNFETPFDVKVFTDPAEGLQAAIATPPDLIFLDLMMPYIRGEEVLEQLKKRNVPTRVVVVTVIREVAKVVEMIKAGACDYITKPFSPTEIVKTAKRVVVLEDTLDQQVEGEDSRLHGKELRQEMLYSLYLNIVEHFNMNELRGLCFQFGIDFETLTGDEKESKIRELVKYCNRHNRVVELAKICAKLRPQVKAFTWISSNFF